MSDSSTVCIYFVASPLQYLAARSIARELQPGARQILVWYKKGLKNVVRPEEWDACAYMAWPRWEPLPGPFGRLKRLRHNIRLVADLAGPCKTLVLHSAVYDTEAINYFLRALPKATGATHMHARILPDGLISIRRYPLGFAKRLIQCFRKTRRLVAPELDYTCFSGDRIGSDAPFCDRIYVLPGLPNEYTAGKVHVLPPLTRPDAASGDEAHQARPGRRALVVGQPLVDKGHMSVADAGRTTDEIYAYLQAHGVTDIDYKGHPKDLHAGLYRPDYRIIEPAEALESYLASTHYDIVAGVRSTTLLFARQIYPPAVDVVAFGWDRIRFKSQQEKDDMTHAFAACGVRFE